MGSKTLKNPPGNPHKILDWDQIDQWLEAHCLGTEIADCIGIHPETLYKRCLKEKKIGWSEYVQRKNASGKILIRAKQFEVGVKKENVDMLKYLGKHVLKQKENDSVAETELQSEFKQFLELHKTSTETNLNNDISRENHE